MKALRTPPLTISTGSENGFAFELSIVDNSGSLARRLEECRKDIEADNEQFGE